MISHEYRCIFVEVPKTGSTSIRRLIGYPPKPHLNLQQIQADMDPAAFERYFKFGFVRNPWDRTVSLYLRREGIQMADQMSFCEFVDWIQNSSDTCIHPTSHKNQLDWFLTPEGRVGVDFIGRFETLQADWQKIAEKLGITADLPHENKNPIRQKPYTEYYTSATRDQIAEKFRVDIEYFGYTFAGN